MNEVINYTSNFHLKKFIHEKMIPEAFPNIPVNKLTLGLTGVIGEYLGNMSEDVIFTSSGILNESFVTTTQRPQNLLMHASNYNLSLRMARPAYARFILQVNIEDITKYSTPSRNTSINKFIIDKETYVVLKDKQFKLLYDIHIDTQMINGQKTYNVYYDIDTNNPFYNETSTRINHNINEMGWLIIVVNMYQVYESNEEFIITDNSITRPRDIILRWDDQLAGLNMYYSMANGDKFPVSIIPKYSPALKTPFVWIERMDDSELRIIFNSNPAFFITSFNSRLFVKKFLTLGAAGNFDQYDNKAGVAVRRSNNRFEYNTSTRMTALSYGPSRFGANGGNIEELRHEILRYMNSADVLTNEVDINLWVKSLSLFKNIPTRLFKRRDDPTGKIYSFFMPVINDTTIFPTNTVHINFNDNDIIRNLNSDIIIKQNRMLTYDGDSKREMIIMNSNDSEVTSNYASNILDNVFINPMYHIINKNEGVSSYNILTDTTLWPIKRYSANNINISFQMATFNIVRNITDDYYRATIIIVPSEEISSYRYTESLDDPEKHSLQDNLLRLLMMFKSDGLDTGYLEMLPIEYRPNGAILFEGKIYVDDILNNGKIEILNNSKYPLTSISGQHVFIDVHETELSVITLLKHIEDVHSGQSFNSAYPNYSIINRFSNNPRELNLYQKYGLMHNHLIENTDSDHRYTLQLVPVVSRSLTLNPDNMKAFMRRFDEIRSEMSPITDRLEGNEILDMKFYNTSGRSDTFFIGPDGVNNHLRDSEILLDNINLRMNLIVNVINRELFTQTINDLKVDIIKFIQNLNGNGFEFYMSDFIAQIKYRHQNIRYMRFVGFNNYGPDKEAIFTKQNTQRDMKSFIPELINISEENIIIREEI